MKINSHKRTNIELNSNLIYLQLIKNIIAIIPIILIKWQPR